MRWQAPLPLALARNWGLQLNGKTERKMEKRQKWGKGHWIE